MDGSVSGEVVANGFLQEMAEGEFDDEGEEGEDEEDADVDDGEREDEAGGGGEAEGEEGTRDDRLGGIWMTRPTARDVLRAPRMRRTFSSMGERDIREGESGFFFGRGYATASPIPLSDSGEDGGAVADEGGAGEAEEEEEEDANEMGGEEEGDNESFTLDEDEYYDSSPEASPRLSVLQLRQDVMAEEDTRPHSNGSFASSSSTSSSSDKAEST